MDTQQTFDVSTLECISAPTDYSKDNYKSTSRKKPMIRTDSDGIETRYESGVEAEDKNGMVRGSLIKIINGINNTTGYQWRYESESVKPINN